MQHNSDIIFSLIDEIYNLENNEDLFYKDINGFCVYGSFRLSIYYYLCKELNIFEEVFKSSKTTFLKNIKYFSPDYLSRLKILNKKNKVFIFPHERKIKYNGFYTDIYTHDIIKSINDCTVIDIPRIRKVNPKDEYKYENYINLSYNHLKIMIKSKLYRAPDKFYKIAEKFNQIYLNKFGVDVFKFIFDCIYKNYLLYEYYLKFLSANKPKLILTTTYYGRTFLIDACRKLGIKTIEIQHGKIYKHHLGYNLNDNLKFSPDYICVFGKYWKDQINIPNYTKIINLGFPYFEKQSKKIIKKIKYDAIFFCQGIHGTKLIKYALKLKKDNPNLKIAYKPHPAQTDDQSTRLKNLIKINAKNKIDLLSNTELTVYNCASITNIFISVSSTIIYEGLALGIKCFIINLSGHKAMKSLYEENYVKLITNFNQLKKELKNFDNKYKNKPNNSIFDKFNAKRLIDLIS